MVYLVLLSQILYIAVFCIFMVLQFENQLCSSKLLSLSSPDFLYSLLLKLGHQK